MHKLDDDTLITADILRKMIDYAGEEGGNEQHYAIFQRADREWLIHNPGSPELDPMQMAYTQHLLSRLNKELHHDGAWVAMWSHPGHHARFMHVPGGYAVLNIIWLDRDGDAKLRVEWVAGQNEDTTHIVELFLAGDLPMAEQAELAWQTTNDLLQATLDLELNEDGDITHKKALGEAAPRLQ